MRPIGHLQDETQARRFAGFLDGEGVESRADPGRQNSWEIWVLDDAHVDAAKSLLDEFRRNPDDPRFTEASHVAVKQKQLDRGKAVPRRARVIDTRTIFYSPPVPLGVVSLTLIGISVVAALFTQLGNEDRFVQPLSITQYQHDGEYLRWNGGLPEVRHGQLWRLFTPIFLHFGLLHILFNMLWLRDLGSMVEARKGPWKLLLLVLALAGTSNFGQYLISGPNFGGMSGVVYGLLGYIWMQGKFNPASRLSLQPQTVTFMIAWFFLCLTGLMGPIANAAHAVGLALGVAWGFLAARIAVQMRHR